MLKMKSISSGVTMAIIATVIQGAPVMADGAPETQFFEDFESYSIVEHYDSSRLLDNAAPHDGVYDATVYPNGTASVYEGNAANNNYVNDYNGTAVYGGLSGWWGFLEGIDKDHNLWNRRLNVFKLTNVAASEINNTQFMKLEPKANQYLAGFAYFERQNIDLEGYSFLSTRISISNGIHEAGIAIVTNPSNQYASASDILSFTKADNGNVEINFGGTKRAEIPLSAFNDGKALDWYTVEYRINRYDGKHSLLMVNDRTKEIIVSTGWETNSFIWSGSDTYGIRYYVNAAYQQGQTRLLLDDIKFTKESFAEDFSAYNTTYVLANYSDITGDPSQRIVNAPGGNESLSEYTNGAYEGALQKNNFMFKTLSTGTVVKSYGNVPFWQGYISDPAVYTAQMIDNQWNMRCNIISANLVALSPYYGTDNVIYLSPKTEAGASTLQTAYAGMENADFALGTLWTTELLLPDVGNADKGTVKLQLTKGHSVTAANGADVSYDGNSHAAYLDVLEIDTYDGSVRFAGQTLSDVQLEQNVKYEIIYAVDTMEAKPTHSIAIRKADDHTAVVAITDMIEISDASFFSGDIIGFRYAVTAKTGQNAKAIIKEVKLDKYFRNVENENKIEILNSDLTTGTAKYELSVKQRQCNVVSASFDKDKRFISATIDYLILPKGVFVRNIENTAGADSIKLMVFDNLYNIKPLCIFDEVASGI